MKRFNWMSMGIVVVACAALGGCAPPRVGFGSLASHTLRVSADQEADIVWVIKVDVDGNDVKETILRCSNGTAGPVCSPAKVAQ
jgi:hypothetical protein